MRDDEGQQQIRVLARLVDELREAVAPHTTPGRRARLLRNVEIVYRYVNEGWSPPELAAQFQLSAAYITNILRWYHIPLSMRQGGLAQRDARIAQAVASGSTVAQIAQRHTLSPKTICRILLQQGILPPEDAYRDPGEG